MNRSEILFLYDVAWTNPNGDPVDENKPRVDEETGKNYVTDVRLKRTIRDFLHDFRGEEIFVREISDENGVIQDAKTRAEDFLLKDGEKIGKSTVSNLAEMKQIIQENMLSQCIDIRLFGGTVPLEKSTKEKGSITLTGPIQFKMGQSLHRVQIQHLKGTGAFAAGENKTQKTFREEYVLPYSLISFYGIVNENAGALTHLQEEDVEKLLDGLWNGTKNLISRSKVGQQPRLLVRVVYQKDRFHIGELDKLVHLQSEIEDEKIRDIEDGLLDMSALVNRLKQEKEHILEVQIAMDGRMETSENLFEALEEENIPTKRLSL